MLRSPAMLPYNNSLIKILLVLVVVFVSSTTTTTAVVDVVSDDYVDTPIEDGTSSTVETTAEPNNNNNNNDNTMVNVACSPNQREFTALTEMRLEGRQQLLDLAERKILKGVFMGIYNDLTTTNCDSYHRKINIVNFIRMSNSVQETYDYQDMIHSNVTTLTANESQLLDDWFNNGNPNYQDQYGNDTTRTRRRQLQQQPQNDAAASLNETDVGVSDVAIIYEVIGTCRDCPLTDVGAFQLYDDSFRRRHRRSLMVGSGGTSPMRGVRITMRTRMLRVRDLALTTTDDNKKNTASSSITNANADCVCTKGVEPKPQAPGVEECVYLMNEQLPQVAETTGLLQNLTLQTLLQLDELSTVVVSVEENGTSTEAPTAEQTPEAEGDGAGEAALEEEEEEEELPEEVAAQSEQTVYTPLEEDTDVETEPENLSSTPLTVARNKDHAALKYNIWGR